MLTRFRVVEGHLADFGALSKTLIAPERNRLESSALCMLIEDSLTDLAIWYKNLKIIEVPCPYSLIFERLAKYTTFKRWWDLGFPKGICPPEFSIDW